MAETLTHDGEHLMDDIYASIDISSISISISRLLPHYRWLMPAALRHRQRKSFRSSLRRRRRPGRYSRITALSLIASRPPQAFALDDRSPILQISLHAASAVRFSG